MFHQIKLKEMKVQTNTIGREEEKIVTRIENLEDKLDKLTTIILNIEHQLLLNGTIKREEE